jgi:hypothetical protein
MGARNDPAWNANRPKVCFRAYRQNEKAGGASRSTGLESQMAPRFPAPGQIPGAHPGIGRAGVP